MFPLIFCVLPFDFELFSVLMLVCLRWLFVCFIAELLLVDFVGLL